MEKEGQLNTSTDSTDEDLNVVGVPSQLVQARPDYVVVEGAQWVPDCMDDKEIRPCSTWMGNTDNLPECKLLLCFQTEAESTRQANYCSGKHRCCKTYLVHILCVVTSFLVLLRDSWLDLLTSLEEVSESEAVAHKADFLPQDRHETGDIVGCLEQGRIGCLPRSAMQELLRGSAEAASVEQDVSHFIGERPCNTVGKLVNMNKIEIVKQNGVAHSLLDLQWKVHALDFKGKRKRWKKVNNLCELWEEDFHFLRLAYVDAFVYPVNQQRSGRNPPPEGSKQAQDTLQTQSTSNGQWPPESACNIPWSAFREELQRLMTFADMPINAPVFVLRLAQTGFLCLPDGRIVCYFCGLHRNAWNAGDGPADIHKRLSPLCPMVTGINCDNQPVSVVPEEQVENLLRIWSLQRAAAPQLTLSGEVANSLGQDPADNLGQGLGQVPQSSRGGATALPAGASPMPLGPTSLPAAHGAYSQTAATPAAYSSLPAALLAADTAGSELPAVSAANSAAGSDLSCDMAAAQSTSQPATQNAGAVSADGSGGSQRVASSSMREALRGPIVDGTAQPAVPLPTLGQEARQSSRLGQGHQVVTYEQLGISTEAPKRTDMAVINTRVASFRNWPPGSGHTPLQLAEAGFYYAGYADCGRCFFCGGGLKNWEANDSPWVEHARWFARCPYVRQCQGQDFVDIVQELNATRRQFSMSEVRAEINRRRADGERLQEPVVDPAISSALENGYTQAQIDRVLRQMQEEGHQLTADKLMDYLLMEEGAQAAGGGVDTSDDSDFEPASVTGSAADLVAENSEIRMRRMCKICLDKEVSIVFLPCGHLVCCAECSPAIRLCPMCRQRVKGRVRAFPG